MKKPYSAKINLDPCRKIPKARRISYREEPVLQKLYLQLTGHFKVPYSRLEKSRSRSCGRPSREIPRSPKVRTTPVKNRYKSRSRSANKIKTEQNRSKSKSKKYTNKSIETLNKLRKKTIIIQPTKTSSQIIKKPQDNLKKKCANLIHNRLMLYRRLEYRNRAATKIQAWVRGHLTRRKLYREYEYMKYYLEYGWRNNDMNKQILIQYNDDPPVDKLNWSHLNHIAKWYSSISDRIMTQQSEYEASIEEGISTNWCSIKQFIIALNQNIVENHYDYFSIDCQQLYGYSVQNKLRMLRYYDCEMDCKRPDMVLDDRLLKNVPERYEEIHQYAVFDCYNEFLTKKKPGFDTFGETYPWNVRRMKVYQPNRIMKKSILEVKRCCNTLCGLLPTTVDEDNRQLEQKREILLKKYLDCWVKYSRYMNIEDELTYIRIWLSEGVLQELLNEFVKSCKILRYVRTLL